MAIQTKMNEYIARSKSRDKDKNNFSLTPIKTPRVDSSPTTFRKTPFTAPVSARTSPHKKYMPIKFVKPCDARQSRDTYIPPLKSPMKKKKATSKSPEPKTKKMGPNLNKFLSKNANNEQLSDIQNLIQQNKILKKENQQF